MPFIQEKLYLSWGKALSLSDPPSSVASAVECFHSWDNRSIRCLFFSGRKFIFCIFVWPVLCHLWSVVAQTLLLYCCCCPREMILVVTTHSLFCINKGSHIINPPIRISGKRSIFRVRFVTPDQLWVEIIGWWSDLSFSLRVFRSLVVFYLWSSVCSDFLACSGSGMYEGLFQQTLSLFQSDLAILLACCLEIPLFFPLLDESSEYSMCRVMVAALLPSKNSRA